jgi:hypothetical protein
MLHDVGTILPTSGKRLGAPITGLDVPTLKGIWQNAPYLHDGRAATLKEIFTRYNPHDQIGHTSSLNDGELDQLVAYLQQLDDVPETNPGCTCSAARSVTTGVLGATVVAVAVPLALLALLQRRRRAPRSGSSSIEAGVVDANDGPEIRRALRDRRLRP